MTAVSTTSLKLIVESEIGFDDEYLITNERKIVIGRGANSNIQIPNDSLASREHCMIFFQESSFILNDLKSSNGTQLNNINIDSCNISNDDLIAVGTTLFRARLETQDIEVKLELDVPNKKQAYDERAFGNEATMAFKTSANAEPKVPFSLYSDEEEEPSSLLENKSDFKVQLLLWQDQDGDSKLSVIAKNTFKMSPGSEAEFSKKSIPIFKKTCFYDDKDYGSVLYESDLVPFKPLADIVVVGKAHTPNQLPKHSLDVGLQVGNTKKIIKVFGDRNWYQAEEDGDFVISEPRPFTAMGLKYERSFGGVDLDNRIYCHKNPIGCGFVTRESLKNIKLRKLPNIENPLDLYQSINSRPNPEGLGFIANNWEPRIQHLGGYEKESLVGDQIGLPENFSNNFYNSAHPDLQVKDYIKGDEKVELVNLSSKGRLIFNLPNIIPEVVVKKRIINTEEVDAQQYDKSHIKMNLDTLVFIPEQDVFYQVYRGVFDLNSMQDIQNTSVLIS